MKAVILFSGGLDSTVALARAIECYGQLEVCCLSLCYGQKHRFWEMGAAARIAHRYGVERVVTSIPLDRWARSSLMQGQEGEMTGKPTVVRGRNRALLAMATGYAEAVRADEVWFGGHMGDAEIYPDCRPEFVAALNAALRCENSPVKIIQPFAGLEKAQVVEIGRRLGAPLEETWSCYHPVGDQPCRTCGACVEREKALG